MVEEESLPWLHRNILHRLLEDSENGANGLLFLAAPGEDDEAESPTKVDFGDGESMADLQQLVIFEYPRERLQPAHHEEQGKGKALASEESRAGEIAASTRYLAVGAPEQCTDTKRERREARETKKRRRARRESTSRSEFVDHEEYVEEAEPSAPSGRGLRYLQHRRSLDDDRVEGENDGEVEMADLRHPGHRLRLNDGEGHGRAGEEDEEADIEKGTERRSLQP